MSAKLLTEHHLEFLSFKGCCTGSSESTHVKMPHCWKSRVTDHMVGVEAAVHPVPSLCYGFARYHGEAESQISEAVGAFFHLVYRKHY